ncbi:MAG TPA: homoserine O-acetyltransferase [Vicinamibacterales bacterium]|nr:homoserine O-acetyltransferase [Vicinamibacterales bacterium]
MAPAAGGRWTVETQYAPVVEGGVDLDCGRRLNGVTVAYECYGRLNAARDNAVLVCHALSGGAHAAGWHAGAAKPGWWDVLIGPGKAFDTDRYFVISSNVLGSCYGTTGPSSVEPSTGRPYGSRFPVVTIADMVRVQRALVDRLGITRLRAVAGGSMGGMQALQWAVEYPDAVQSVIALATSPSHSPQQIAFNEIARRAVMSDPNWRGGDYYHGEPPRAGLAVARMLGHVTYLSERGMRRKFGRRRRPDARPYGFDTEFEVETYLEHQARAFVDRFDANSLLYVTRAIDYFDLAPPGGTLRDAFAGSEADYLFLTFSSDWLYPPRHLEAAAEAARAAGRRVSYREIPSDDGHDAFLLEHEAQAPIIRAFLGDRAS